MTAPYIYWVTCGGGGGTPEAVTPNNASFHSVARHSIHANTPTFFGDSTNAVIVV